MKHPCLSSLKSFFLWTAATSAPSELIQPNLKIQENTFASFSGKVKNPPIEKYTCDKNSVCCRHCFDSHEDSSRFCSPPSKTRISYSQEFSVTNLKDFLLFIIVLISDLMVKSDYCPRCPGVNRTHPNQHPHCSSLQNSRFKEKSASKNSKTLKVPKFIIVNKSFPHNAQLSKSTFTHQGGISSSSCISKFHISL